MKSHPILYSFRRCPYAMRARMALVYAGVTCELREVVLKNKPAHLIELSPKATVPVLWLSDKTIIDESLDIMLWALEQSDPADWAGHRDVIWEDIIQQQLVPQLMRYKYPDRYLNEESDPQEAKAHCDQLLAQLNERLVSGYLCGDQLGISDIAIFPFLRQLRLVDTDWFDNLAYGHLHGWLSQVFELLCYQQAMEKIPVWQQNQPQIHYMPSKTNL